jgi:hypothetical protein
MFVVFKLLQPSKIFGRLNLHGRNKLECVCSKVFPAQSNICDNLELTRMDHHKCLSPYSQRVDYWLKRLATNKHSSLFYFFIGGGEKISFIALTPGHRGSQISPACPVQRKKYDHHPFPGIR